MQRLHFQKLKTVFFLFSVLCALPHAVLAQYSEALINSEYRDIILKQLQQSIADDEATLRTAATNYLLQLPNDRKLYDESKMSIKTDLVSGINAEGLRELNYRIVLNYSCHHFENKTDNYPSGKYLCQESNAAMAIVEIARTAVDDICSSAFKQGKKVDICFRASTDISPVSHLDYKGEYGEYKYIAARYNDEPVRISVSPQSGINTNAQLAFLRAQGLRHNLLQASVNLQHTTNSYSYLTQSFSETGSQYRDVGIEILVHGAFDEEIVEMNERLINDEFVDYNIPKNTENSNPSTFVLVIANERYSKPLPDVPYAYNDGEIFQKYCIRTLGIPARQVKIVEDATLTDIRTQGINWLKNIATAQNGNCNFVIYFAGHGITDFNHAPYLIPAGIDTRRIKALRNSSVAADVNVLSRCDTKNLLKQCLSVDTLCSWFNRVPMQSLTIFLDASFDGNQRTGMPLLNIKHSKAKARGLRIRNDIVVMSASSFDKTAYAFDEQHHGFFTYFLLKQLKSSKGIITHGHLYNEVDKALRKESSLQGLLQEPSIIVGGKLKDNWESLRLRPVE